MKILFRSKNDKKSSIINILTPIFYNFICFFGNIYLTNNQIDVILFNVVGRCKMNFDNASGQHLPQVPKTDSPPFLSPDNVVAIYTVLAILRRMKLCLSIEAMLEYMDAYLSVLEKNNQDFKMTVTRVLEVLNVEKMYRDVIDADKE